MSGPHKRKSLRSLLQDAKEKMAQSPEHVRAAQVLAEMQEDLHTKMSGGIDRGDRPVCLSGVNVRGASLDANGMPTDAELTGSPVPSLPHEENSSSSPASHHVVCPVPDGTVTSFPADASAVVQAPAPYSAPVSAPSTASIPVAPVPSPIASKSFEASEKGVEEYSTTLRQDRLFQEESLTKMSGVDDRYTCPGSSSGVQGLVSNMKAGDEKSPIPELGSENETPKQATPSVPGAPANTRRTLPQPETSPKRRKPVREILPQRSRIVGERQKELHAWLMAQGGAVRTTLPLLTEMTGIEDRSLRRILTAWEANGIAEKRSGQFGIEIKVLLHEKPGPTRREKAAEAAEELADICPSLCAAGFTRAHLNRILAALARQGLDTASVWTGLRYAEWELTHEHMLDKAGKPVSSPVDWVYKSLVNDGTYRIPKAYRTPAEIQRQQAEEELAREREALATLQRLREEREALELQRQVDAHLDQLASDPDTPFAQAILQALPHFIRELGVENPLFQKACRTQIERHLKELAGIGEVRS